MAASTDDDSEDDNFVVLGTPVPELAEGEAQKKPTTLQDLTARDKQGRRRFHGAFTGGFSAGYFNTVGTKEGFTPSSFLSSRSQKSQRSENMPEDFMDEEDFEEHGIAPRKFATVGTYTSQERKRKFLKDSEHLIKSSQINLVPSLTDLIVPEQLPIGIKILRKMGWREGQGLGPRLKQKKKKKRSTVNLPSTKSDSKVKIYGCALPSDHGESDSDDYVPENMSDVTFAPKDVCPISLEVKDNVHGLGYRGLDPGLALPSSHINLFEPNPVRSLRGGKGIQGQAFGVGAFEEEDEDIYTVDNMSNYDLTMSADNDEGDSKFGWTAPRDHGKQVVPVTYFGQLLEGFTLSSQSLKPKKKFQPPALPRHFRPQHWFRKRRETSHLPTDFAGDDRGTNQKRKISAIDRGLMLGETPIMDSVFDLVPKEDKNRIEATKQAIAITQSLSGRPGFDLASKFQPAQDAAVEKLSSAQPESAGTSNTFLPKFQPADDTSSHDVAVRAKVTDQSDKAPLFQGGLNFQPFRKDPGKQTRYDTYLTSLKQGTRDPYASVESSHMTEWEKARERDEFSKAAKIYRPMSALMSSRFVRGAMIDDDKVEVPLDAESEKSDHAKAADMKMFGKLTRDEFEWHPDKLLCRRFNVPNPYPESDLVGLPTVKRDKYSVFNFLNFGDYQSGDVQEPSVSTSEILEPEPRGQKSMKPVQSRKTTMASIFKVLDDPDFHKPVHQSIGETEDSSEKTHPTEKGERKDKNEKKDNSDTEPDKDLFRAIFKNSDSESSSENSADEKKDETVSEEEVNKSDSDNRGRWSMESSRAGELANLSKSVSEVSSTVAVTAEISSDPVALLSTSVHKAEVKAKRSRWGDKPIFSVLDDLDQDDASTENRQTSVAATMAQNVQSRLLPPNSSYNDEDNDREYGPASSLAVVSDFHQQVSENIDKTENSRHREHRHKKEKKKKSKHKKEKRHKKHRKSSKSRRSRKEKNSSGSEADTENSDVSDNELLQRLKKVSQSEALQVLKTL